MMAATQEDLVVVSDSSDVLSDTENGEWLELELQSLLEGLDEGVQVSVAS